MTLLLFFYLTGTEMNEQERKKKITTDYINLRLHGLIGLTDKSKETRINLGEKLSSKFLDIDTPANSQVVLPFYII